MWITDVDLVRPRRLGRLLAMAIMAIAVAFMLVLPVRAADEQPAAKRMKVSVWPEYDEPRVLVIYEGEFADASPFPRRVSFRLPAGAEVSQVCALRPSGEHLCQLYELATDADGVTLTYELPIPTFFLEFYYHPIDGAGERSLNYEFTPLSAVESLQLEVQQPARATNFRLDPPTTLRQSDGAGLTYFLYNYEKVEAGKPIKVGISYAKSDAKPSTEKKQPSASAGAGTTSGGFATSWVIIAAGMVAVGGVVGYSLLSRRQSYRARYSPVYGAGRVPAPPATSHGTGRQKAVVRFCSACGEPVGPSARFCAMCGEPVRR